VPWFINWSDYRPSFESQASRILGHPVHVLGSARASILPSPSVTFTDVAVGDPAHPLMTVSRFAVTVELVPLIQGQIHVVAMKLDEPSVHVLTAADGSSEWLQRAPAADAIAPDSVALTDVSITNGALDYKDASNGVAFTIAGIDATVDAASLAGPWKLSGSYAAGPVRPTFEIATGRAQGDGSIRVKAETSPPQYPVRVDLDGALSLTPGAGLKYAGTYDVAETTGIGQSAPDSAPASGATATSQRRWTSQGAFTLTRERLAIEKAVLSRTPADGATSVAGSGSISFGTNAAFVASVEARQLDLDRVLGGGASRPASVADALSYLVGLAATAPSPPIPGRITAAVPAIVIGGAVVQNVALTAATAPDGWAISGLHADLPGQGSLKADGNLTMGRQLGFRGSVHFAVAQPGVLAGWWRGTAPPVSAIPLPAFAAGGEADIGIDRFALANATATVGAANMTGSFSWSRDRQFRRELDTDLKADHIDIGDLGALAGLVTGSELADLRTLADRFQVRLSADTVVWKGLSSSNVAIDAGYADDTLKVVQFSVGDLRGASIRVTGGRIDGLTSASASGHLEAHVEAPKVDGLVRVAAILAPSNIGLSTWLSGHASLFGPAALDVRVAAPAAEGPGAFSLGLSGNLGSTAVSASLRSEARPAEVWTGVDRLSLSASSADSAAFARQFGLDAATPDKDAGAHVAIELSGTPAKGLSTTIDAAFAGLAVTGSGTTVFDPDFKPSFKGALKATSDNVAPFLATAGIVLPGLGDDSAADLSGTASVSASGLSFAWENSRLAGRSLGGNATIAPVDGRWRLSGAVALDLVDLRWLTAASLGVPLEAGPDPATPWSKVPFSVPDRGALATQLALSIDRLVVSDALVVDKAAATLTANAERVDLNLTDGSLAEGKLNGGLSVRNPDGNASLAARLTLRGAALAPFVWQADGAPVATGSFDLTANLEASGRSVAAVVASLTGGGTLALHGGTVRGVNADAVAPIVRVADRGQPYPEDALRASVESELGLGDISFTDAGAAFAVAAGVVRLNDLAVDTPRLALSGDTALDLNKLAIDSAWTCTFKSATSEAEPPGIGVSWRGPLNAPARSIDVVPLSAYLSTRQAARMIQVLAIQDADRLEQERFAREILRFRSEGMRGDREKRADAAAAEAQAQAARAALVRAADLTAAARDTAVAAANAAASAAADAHTRASAAAAALADATSALDAAKAAEVAAVTEVADARSASNTASATAASLATAATTADNAVALATSATASAKAAADKVDAATREANARLDAARAKAADADAAAAAASKEAEDAGAALDAAGHEVSDALTRSDAARAALAVAERDLGSARQEADRATTAAAAAVQAATTSQADRARLAMLARVAAGALAAAKSDQDEARQLLQDASTAAANAQMDVDRAEQEGVPAFTFAARRTAADTARQALQGAHDRYAAAETSVANAKAAADAADAAAAKAADAATMREAEAQGAAAAKTTAIAALAVSIKARETAAAEVAAAGEAAKTAGAAFDSAQARAHTATDRAASTAADARSADAEVSSATRAAAATQAGSAGFALQQAQTAETAAVADAAAAHAKADAAAVAATDAAARLSAAIAAHDGAVTARIAADAKRAAAAKARTDADRDAQTADDQADVAAAVARQRTAEAAGAAAALQGSAPVARSAAPPARQKPQKPVAGALVGEEPLLLVPPAQ
jgi:uncharacterized protein involved in outer membrane biogenesis